MPMFDFFCARCNDLFEDYLKSYKSPNPPCPTCASKTDRTISTPAFTFSDGRGTDGGLTMRIAGHRVPGDNVNKYRKPQKKVK